MKFQIVINWLGVSNCDFFPYLRVFLYLSYPKLGKIQGVGQATTGSAEANTVTGPKDKLASKEDMPFRHAL